MKIVIIGGTGRAAIVARPALATELALVMAATIEADGKKLLEEAIAVAGLEPPQFAREILDVDARSVDRALAGDRDLHGTVRVVCAAIVARPVLAAELSAARASAAGSADSDRKSGDAPATAPALAESPLTDPELVGAAIEASGLSASAFARDVLVRDPRTVFRMLSGETPISPVVRAKCEAIVAAAGDHASRPRARRDPRTLTPIIAKVRAAYAIAPPYRWKRRRCG